MFDYLSFGLLFLVSLIVASLLACHFRTGVPPMPSRMRERADVVALLKEARLAPGAVIYELGSGWGSLVIAIAQAFPQSQVRGVELSPFPYWIARLRTRHLPNVVLTRGDFFRCDLSDANAVTCYLMIGPMKRVAAMLDRALAPATPVVTVTFAMRDRQAVAERRGNGLRGGVSLYRWPAHRRA